jgi:hypothetical protein
MESNEEIVSGLSDEFMKELQILCDKNGFEAILSDKLLLLRTQLDEIGFELTENYIILRYKRLRGKSQKKEYGRKYQYADIKPQTIIKIVSGLQTKPEYDYTESVFKEVQDECTKRGLRCELRFGEIHIFTVGEEFYFVPNTTDRITLMHRSSFELRKDIYHLQFRNWKMTPKEVVRWISGHTNYKFRTKGNR